MADASHEINRTLIENKPQDSPSPELTYILPSLILPLLVSAVIVGSVLLYRTPSYAWLSPSPYAQIAFMSDRQGNWQLYMMDRDGSHLRNLTNSPSNDGAPVHSPGQNWLIFTSDRNGPSPN